MQGPILYVGAKTDSNDLHRDIHIELYGAGSNMNNLIIPNQLNYSTGRPLRSRATVSLFHKFDVTDSRR